MLGLTSPSDYLNALLSAQKTDNLAAARKQLDAKSAGKSFEDILLEMDWKMFQPERAIMKALDANRDAEEERRTGRKTASVFDGLAGAQVAGAVGSFYNLTEAEPDLTLDDPFSLESAFKQLQPRISAEVRKIGKAHGIAIDSSTDSLSLAGMLKNPAAALAAYQATG